MYIYIYICIYVTLFMTFIMDHNSGRKCENWTNDRIFLFNFVSSIMWSPAWPILFCKIPEITYSDIPSYFFYNVDTLKTLKTHIMFDPPRGTGKTYRFMDYLQIRYHFF